MKYFKTVFTLIFVMLISSSAIGQKEETLDQGSSWHNHTFRFGITPSALANENLGFQLNAAVNLSSKFQINLEAGKIILAALSDISSISGYRLRPAIRYYVIHEEEYLLHVSVAYNMRRTSIKKIRNFVLQPLNKNSTS